MPTVKISALSAASLPLGGTEVLPIVQGGTTFKTTVRDVANLASVDAVSNALSVEIANRISADNALSVRIDTQSQAVSALSQAVSIVSQSLSLETANRISADNALSNALSDAISVGVNTASGLSIRIDTQSQSISVLSQQVSVLSQAISVVSQALSLETANRVSAVNVVSNSLSVETANRISADNVLSANINTVSNAVSIVSQALSVETANRVSAINVVSNAVSVVSQALSVETANRISAVNVVSNAVSVLSQQISVLSQQVSVISQQISVLSQAVSVLSQQISVISAGLGGMQMKVLQGAFTISVSAATNISGLSISVAAGGTYQLEGQLMYQTSLITAVGFGLSYPQLAAAMGRWNGYVSVAAGTPEGLGVSLAVDFYIMESAAAANSNAVIASITPQNSAGFTYGMWFDYLLNVSTAGTVAVMAKQAGASPGFVILKGSFVRAYKVA